MRLCLRSGLFSQKDPGRKNLNPSLAIWGTQEGSLLANKETGLGPDRTYPCREETTALQKHTSSEGRIICPTPFLKWGRKVLRRKVEKQHYNREKPEAKAGIKGSEDLDRDL